MRPALVALLNGAAAKAPPSSRWRLITPDAKIRRSDLPPRVVRQHHGAATPPNATSKRTATRDAARVHGDAKHVEQKKDAHDVPQEAVRHAAIFIDRCGVAIADTRGTAMLSRYSRAMPRPPDTPSRDAPVIYDMMMPRMIHPPRCHAGAADVTSLMPRRDEPLLLSGAMAPARWFYARIRYGYVIFASALALALSSAMPSIC